MNAFELLLKQRFDTYVAAAKLVRAAKDAGAFPSLESREQPAFTAPYWCEPLEGRVDLEVQFPGTRGGLLWRYFVAMGTWLSLLGRVNNLLGPIACITVQGLGRQSGDLRVPNDEKAIGLIQAALRSSDFSDYVRARFGEGETLRAQEQELEALLSPAAAAPAAEVVDFLSHVFIQDFELVDLAGLPDVWESLAQLRTDASVEQDLYGLGYNAEALLRGLADLAQSINSQRQGIRRLITQALDSDGVLKSLVLGRLLPFAESHFLVADRQNRRDLATASLAFVVIEQDYASRSSRRRDVDFSRLRPLGSAATLTERWVQVLSRVSVPFLLWCAKSRIPLAQLWSEVAGTVSVWPNFTYRSRTDAYVAIASNVDKGTFRRAVQFLVTTLQRHPEATCLFVTDHWNEEEAAAAYQVVSDRRSTEPIIVLRSDGTRYPLSVFTFPTQ
jgi:hypothetical protein